MSINKTTKHTPEPWRRGKTANSIVSDSKDGLTINGSYDERAKEFYGGYLIAESVTEANARRIIACVNACSDVPTEELERSMEPKKNERLDIMPTRFLTHDEALILWCPHRDQSCVGAQCAVWRWELTDSEYQSRCDDLEYTARAAYCPVSIDYPELRGYCGLTERPEE